MRAKNSTIITTNNIIAIPRTNLKDLKTVELYVNVSFSIPRVPSLSRSDFAKPIALLA